MSKISVIVPIYKVENYLNRCIDSILNQTYTDFELILVDDGSPDNCPKICDDYAKKDKRVKVIHKKTVVFLMREILVLIMRCKPIANGLHLLIAMIGCIVVIWKFF